MADSVTPGKGSQPLNRYAYVYNSPIIWVDPSGYDPLDQEWEGAFVTAHGYEPDSLDRQIRLLSIAFPDEWAGGGTGQMGDQFYFQNGQRRSDAEILQHFQQAPSGRDWANMPNALTNLSGSYTSSETEMFVRDVGTLFAGLIGRWEEASTWRAINGGVHYVINSAGSFVHLGANGISPDLVGTDVGDSNVHHWAWCFVLGYDRGSLAGQGLNTAREYQQFWSNQSTMADLRADITLGNSGVRIGNALRGYTSPIWGSPLSPQAAMSRLVQEHALP